MLLSFTDEQKTHLAFLTSCDLPVLSEFCRICVEFLNKGPNSKLYQTAASKLGEESEKIRRSVEALINLFLQSSKHMVNEKDFKDSVLLLGFEDEAQKLLCSTLMQNEDAIRELLGQMRLDERHYHNLEWRFDVQISSRFLAQREPDPLITLRLDTEQYGRRSTNLLQTDPVNLRHLIDSLERADQELKGQHARRLVRNIK